MLIFRGPQWLGQGCKGLRVTWVHSVAPIAGVLRGYVEKVATPQRCSKDE